MRRVWSVLLVLVSSLSACDQPAESVADAGFDGGRDADQLLGPPLVMVPESGREADAEAGTGAPDASLDAAVSDALVFAGRSEGCGKPHMETGELLAFGTNAGGLNRTYYAYVPRTYDPTRAYPLVFRFHGRGSDSKGTAIELEAVTQEDALILAPVGLLQADNVTFDWTKESEALDLALYDKLVRWAADQYCIDLDRVFAYGFASGGGMASLLACVRGDELRGIGTVAATYRAGGETCSGQTAAYLVHDSNDAVVSLAEGIDVRERLRAQNSCASESDALGSCLRYRDCAPGQSVVWCQTTTLKASAHQPGGAAVSRPIWSFLQDLVPPP